MGQSIQIKGYPNTKISLKLPKVKKRKLEIKAIRFDKKSHPQLSIELFESDGISSNYAFGLKEVSNNDSIYEMDTRKFNINTNLWEEINPSILSLKESYKSYNNSPDYINEIENYDSFINELFNVNELVVWKNQGKGEFKNENGSIVVFDDNDPKWKSFLQAYNDWIFRNFTIKTPNWMPQTPFDARGYELYFHWCNGTGRTLDYTEGLWGDYMSDNNYIRFYLIEEAYYDALDMKSSNKETLIKGESEEFNFEIENGYFSGYEMLHGTNFFKLISTHGVLNPTDNTYKFTFKLRWKDTINPNARQGD